MNEIVFLSPNTKEPFTTSEVIAEAVRVKRDTVQKLIYRNEKDFKEFGLLGFEIQPVKVNYPPPKGSGFPQPNRIYESEKI